MRIWGICKESKVYRYFGGDLVLLEKNDNHYVISDYVSDANKKNQALFLGGAIGGAIIGSKQKIYDVKGFSYISDYFPEANSIDMETGKLVF